MRKRTGCWASLCKALHVCVILYIILYTIFVLKSLIYIFVLGFYFAHFTFLSSSNCQAARAAAALQGTFCA